MTVDTDYEATGEPFEVTERVSLSGIVVDAPEQAGWVRICREGVMQAGVSVPVIPFHGARLHIPMAVTLEPGTYTIAIESDDI